MGYFYGSITNNKGNVPTTDNRNIPLFHHCFTFILSPTRTVLYCYYCMYRALAYPKLTGRLTNGRSVLNDIIRNFHSPFFNIISHKKPLHRFVFYNLCRGVLMYVCHLIQLFYGYLDLLCISISCIYINDTVSFFHCFDLSGR